MKILITGSGGFLGSYVVEEALREGFEVRATLRSSKRDYPWSPKVETLTGDLSDPIFAAMAVDGVDAVVHLAATKQGDLSTQAAGTIRATENLLLAMKEKKITRLIGISTFAVYDFSSCAGAEITETSCLERHTAFGNPYTLTKLQQERLYLDFAYRTSSQVTVLRPGIVFGRSELWNAYLGEEIGSWRVLVGGQAKIPLIYAENCAQAIVQSLKTPASGGKILNLIDDELPTQERYYSLIKNDLSRKRTLGVPWIFLRTLIWFGEKVERFIFGKTLKLPGLLDRRQAFRRFGHFGYPNDRAKEILAWRPRYKLEEALQRSRC